MCGLTGYIASNQASDFLSEGLKRACKKMQHRGPDHTGYWFHDSQNIGFGHTRLSIIDLNVDANQPLQSADGRFVICYNGEIYNYAELKKDLKALGSHFTTNSDTEVLIEAYRQWGHAMLNKLRGMFAFVLFDKKHNISLIARDPLGKKPFIYSCHNNSFLFASELPAILQMMPHKPQINPHAIASIFARNMRHIPDPYTAYDGIFRLPAGHAMTVQDGKIIEQWRYWHIAENYDGDISSDALLKLLETSVERRMVSDVPVGVLLSGGVDSTAIAAIASRSQAKMHSYVIGADEQDDDIQRARIMAEKLGTIHTEVFFHPDEHWDGLHDIIKTYGEPIMLLPLSYSRKISAIAKQDGIKVLLSGNGADELFYGYNGMSRIYKASLWAQALSPLHAILKPFVPGKFQDLFERPGARKASLYKREAHHEQALFIPQEKRRDLNNIVAEQMQYWGGVYPQKLYIDEANFLGLMTENTHSVTTASDLPSMMESVEMRAPFLDRDIVDFAMNCPANLKLKNTGGRTIYKAILRDSVSHFMPDALLHAPKRGLGFGIQEDTLFKGAWREKVDNILSNPCDADGLLCPDLIRKAWHAFLKGEVSANPIAKQLAVQIWLREQA